MGATSAKNHGEISLRERDALRDELRWDNDIACGCAVRTHKPAGKPGAPEADQLARGAVFTSPCVRRAGLASISRPSLFSSILKGYSVVNDVCGNVRE